VLVYSLLFGIGKVVLADYWYATVFFAIAIGSAFGIYKQLEKSGWKSFK
jgi:hypothetical protein